LAALVHKPLLAASVNAKKRAKKAGWTNDLHYPIGLKITRRNGLAEDEKGLRGKHLRGKDRPLRHDLTG